MSAPFYQVMKEAREGSPYPRLMDFAERIGMSSSGYKKLEMQQGHLPPRDKLEHIIWAGQVGERKGKELMHAWHAAIASRHGITLDYRKVDINHLAQKIENEVQLLLRQCRTPMPKVAYRVFSNRLKLILNAMLES